MNKLIWTGRTYSGECDNCHNDDRVFVFEEEFDSSGEWDYCADCTRKLGPLEVILGYDPTDGDIEGV